MARSLDVIFPVSTTLSPLFPSIRECKNTLPMAKTKTMVLVFGFSFPFLRVSKEKVVLVSRKSGFSFWFQFLPERRGWGISASFDNNKTEN